MIKEYIIKIDEDQDKKDIHGGYPLTEPPLELVRCKDCIHWDNLTKFCGTHSVYLAVQRTLPDWFCADGERQ